MLYFPRNFLTNVWIAIHTLATYITDQCENPWELPATHEMHSNTASRLDEVQNFAEKLFGIHGHLQRLLGQIRRSYIILRDCKYYTGRKRVRISIVLVTDIRNYHSFVFNRKQLIYSLSDLIMYHIEMPELKAVSYTHLTLPTNREV